MSFWTQTPFFSHWEDAEHPGQVSPRSQGKEEPSPRHTDMHAHTDPQTQKDTHACTHIHTHAQIHTVLGGSAWAREAGSPEVGGTSPWETRQQGIAFTHRQPERPVSPASQGCGWWCPCTEGMRGRSRAWRTSGTQCRRPAPQRQCGFSSATRSLSPFCPARASPDPRPLPGAAAGWGGLRIPPLRLAAERSRCSAPAASALAVTSLSPRSCCWDCN